MTTKARLILVVAVSLVTLGEGNLGADSARAEENCLPAPNAPAPQGSHWYYRTDPVKQRKCWYLRTEGQAIQKQAAQEKPETGVTAKRPAAVTAIIAPDQSGLRTPRTSTGSGTAGPSADRPTKGSIQHGAQASRQAGADKVAWPDPPSSANASRVAWPDTPSSASAGGVMWPDPPSPTRADKVAWPNPPLPAGAATHGATAENTPEERANQAQEVPGTPANSDKDAGTDAGKDRQVAKPIETAVSHGQMPVDMLLALAIGLILAGIIARLIVRMTIGRRRTVDPDRREVV